MKIKNIPNHHLVDVSYIAKKNPGEEGEPPSQGASKPQVNRSIHHLRLPMGPADAPQGAFVLLISINAPGVRLNGSSIVVVESSHPNVNEKWGSSSPKFRGEGQKMI